MQLLPPLTITRLAISVLAYYGMIPVLLYAYGDKRPNRRAILATGGLGLLLWAAGWCIAPSLPAASLGFVVISALRNICLGSSLTAAAYIDGLVLCATVPARGPLKSAALWLPVAAELLLASARGSMSVARDSFSPDSATYQALNNATYGAIALELVLAAATTAAAAARLSSILSAAAPRPAARLLLVDRWRFATEVFVYAAGALLVTLLGLLGLLDLPTVGILVNAAEVQYLVRVLLTWAQGIVEPPAAAVNAAVAVVSPIAVANAAALRATPSPLPDAVAAHRHSRLGAIQKAVHDAASTSATSGTPIPDSYPGPTGDSELSPLPNRIDENQLRWNATPPPDAVADTDPATLEVDSQEP
ncbi:hypothetical protein HK405_014617 [Cladochytrium tenue]|nr:hypothetical protein HK405_014617 [Cladochytrium tenue]